MEAAGPVTRAAARKRAPTIPEEQRERRPGRRRPRRRWVGDRRGPQSWAGSLGVLLDIMTRTPPNPSVFTSLRWRNSWRGRPTWRTASTWPWSPPSVGSPP
uniref:Uncharacterized protein n=1 Tax=Ursus americanus TaxID=9643 RepID=A0A452QJ93_URSAM